MRAMGVRVPPLEPRLSLASCCKSFHENVGAQLVGVLRPHKSVRGTRADRIGRCSWESTRIPNPSYGVRILGGLPMSLMRKWLRASLKVWRTAFDSPGRHHCVCAV